MNKYLQRRRKPNRAAQPQAAPTPSPQPEVAENPRTRSSLMLALLILVVVIWSYGPALSYLAKRWWNDPDYLYGFLVPVVSGYLLWIRRDMLQSVKFRGNWLGWVLILLAGAMRLGARYYFLRLPEPLSLVPCLAGVGLIIGGWPALKWSWPAISFLAFMVPVPGPLAGILSHPLQRVGAIASTFVIQTLGIPSVARGNIIVLSSTELGVAEACNGLPMMMLFVAVCFAAVFLSDRTWYEKLIILGSAAPIAVIANVIRISLTALLYELGGVELGNKVFHDLAGWFMMPLAVLLLWGLLWFLDHAFVAQSKARPVFDRLSI